MHLSTYLGDHEIDKENFYTYSISYTSLCDFKYGYA